MVSNTELVELTSKYLIDNYGRLPVAMARGEGAKIWDADGREYLDLFPGFGAGGVAGHWVNGNLEVPGPNSYHFDS